MGTRGRGNGLEMEDKSLREGKQTGTDLREEMARRGGRGRGTEEAREDTLSRWLRDRSGKAEERRHAGLCKPAGENGVGTDTWQRRKVSALSPLRETVEGEESDSRERVFKMLERGARKMGGGRTERRGAGSMGTRDIGVMGGKEALEREWADSRDS